MRRAIGGRHEISFYTHDDTIVGLIDWHLKPDGSQCSGGSVMFDIPETAEWPGRDKWQLHSLDPLHLEPSLLCTVCGEHGWIRSGKWVPA